MVKLGRELEPELELELILGRELEREHELVQEVQREREREQHQDWQRESALELAQILAQVPLVLAWQLARNKRGVLPGELISNWSGGCSEFFNDVMIKMMSEAGGDICRELSNLAHFPASFSVSLVNKYSDPVESNAPDVKLYKVTPTQLDRHMIEVIENHAARVARWRPGSRAEVKADILDGMWRTWKCVSGPCIFHSCLLDLMVAPTVIRGLIVSSKDVA